MSKFRRSVFLIFVLVYVSCGNWGHEAQKNRKFYAEKSVVKSRPSVLHLANLLSLSFHIQYVTVPV